MRLNSKFKVFVKIFFLIIFIGYASCVSFFTHRHVVDGVIIIHSHPCALDKNGNPLHQHTKSEYNLISALSVYFVNGLIAAFIALALRRVFFTRIHAKTFYNHLFHISIPNLRLRAPPVNTTTSSLLFIASNINN